MKIVYLKIIYYTIIKYYTIIYYALLCNFDNTFPPQKSQMKKLEEQLSGLEFTFHFVCHVCQTHLDQSFPGWRQRRSGLWVGNRLEYGNWEGSGGKLRPECKVSKYIYLNKKFVFLFWRTSVSSQHPDRHTTAPGYPTSFSGLQKHLYSSTNTFHLN